MDDFRPSWAYYSYFGSWAYTPSTTDDKNFDTVLTLKRTHSKHQSVERVQLIVLAIASSREANVRIASTCTWISNQLYTRGEPNGMMISKTRLKTV